MVTFATGVQPAKPYSHEANERMVKSILPDGGIETVPADGPSNSQENRQIVRRQVLADGTVEPTSNRSILETIEESKDEVEKAAEDLFVESSNSFWKHVGHGEQREGTQIQPEPALVGFEDSTCGTELGGWLLPFQATLDNVHCQTVKHSNEAQQEAWNNKRMSMTFECAPDASSLRVVLHYGSGCSDGETMKLNVSGGEFHAMRQGKCTTVANYMNAKIEYIRIMNADGISEWPSCMADRTGGFLGPVIGIVVGILIIMGVVGGCYLYNRRVTKAYDAQQPMMEWDPATMSPPPPGEGKGAFDGKGKGGFPGKGKGKGKGKAFAKGKFGKGEGKGESSGEGKPTGGLSLLTEASEEAAEASEEPPSATAPWDLPEKPEDEDFEEFDMTATVQDTDLGFQHAVYSEDDGFVFTIGEISGGWAEEQGLWEGDELWKVNGVNVDDMTGQQLTKALKARPLSLTIRRWA